MRKRARLSTPLTTRGANGRAADSPLLARLRRRQRWLRRIAVAVAAAFLNLYLQPLALAANLPSRPAPEAKEPSNEERLSRTIQAIEDRLERLEAKVGRGEQAAKEKSEITALRQELQVLDQAAVKDFEAIERHLKDRKLPQAILDRHYEAVRTYKEEMATLKANLDALQASPDDADRGRKAKRAREHLKAKQAKRGPKTRFDPNDLPNKSLQPNPENKPRLRKEQFIRAGLLDHPPVQLAAHGSYRIDQLPGANDPAFLAATTEVVLTDAIRAKAAELEHNPVKIYSWVRNNVEWLPSWGAAQDADVTLGSRRGNALDIASLLIALLRASDIPARYAHGVIEVPEDKFRNWAGGFTGITAAANYASSGGIPIATVVSGGRITKIQLEHIWVEAAIDFHPSRGGVNKSADSWVSLDPSYKQYQDLQGLDALAISGINPETLAQSFFNSGTINEQEGWAVNQNLAVLQDAQTQAQAALTNHVTANFPNPTVGDVIGGRRIIARTASVLPTALPNRVPVVGARYGRLPDQLQDTMTFAFGVDLLGELIAPVTFPWSRLNNHKVTLSFKPASAADEQALASLLPPGPITDPSQIPGSIPSYLVFVVPEIAVDGQVVGRGSAMRLGEDLNFIYYISRISGGSHSYNYAVPAGSYLAIAVAGGSVSAAAIDAVRTKRQQTQATLQSGNAAAIAALTREDIMGDTFHGGALGYFSQYIALAHVASLPQQARHSLPYAYGTLGYEPNVQTLFGLPRAIKPGGIGVNVRLAWNLQALDGDGAKRLALAQQAGVLSSALEHAVPEQMFSTRDRPKQGISAVKALQIAAQQGQRIYHITPANAAQALPNLHLDGLALSEINQALATGKEVVAHTDRISVPGFIGEGYILFDPATGDGAYKITGGSNGGVLNDFLNDMNLLVTVFGFLAAIAAFALIGAGLGAALLLAFSNLLAVIGVALTIWYVFNATGSVGDALAAGLLATLAAVYIGAVVSALVWSIGLGTTVLAAVAFLFVVTVIVSLILAFLVWLLTANAAPDVRRRMLAFLDLGKALVRSAERSLMGDLGVMAAAA